MRDKDHTLDSMVRWASFLEDYAKDWDSTFNTNAHYFTQEYWYLLIRCTLSYWQGKPVNVTTACEQMKSGSMRTREERIKKACFDGYLAKQVDEHDHRQIIITPTALLEELVEGHLRRTFEQANSVLCQ